MNKRNMTDGERRNFMTAESQDWNERHRQDVHAQWEAGELTREQYDGMLAMFDGNETGERQAIRAVFP